VADGPGKTRNIEDGLFEESNLNEVEYKRLGTTSESWEDDPGPLWRTSDRTVKVRSRGSDHRNPRRSLANAAAREATVHDLRYNLPCIQDTPKMKMDENTGSKTQFFSAMRERGMSSNQRAGLPRNEPGSVKDRHRANRSTFNVHPSLFDRSTREVRVGDGSCVTSANLSIADLGTPRRAFAYAIAVLERRRRRDDVRVIVPATSTVLPTREARAGW